MPFNPGLGDIILTGTCNEWSISNSFVLARKPREPDDDGQERFEIGVRLEEQSSLDFYLVSRSGMLVFGIYPPGGIKVLADAVPANASISLMAAGGGQATSGCFRIKEEIGSLVKIGLRFKTQYHVWYDKVSVDPPAAPAEKQQEEEDEEAAPADAPQEDLELPADTPPATTLPPPTASAPSRPPRQLPGGGLHPMDAFGGKERLRLVGGFSHWKLNRPGLVMDAMPVPSGAKWREHRLCVRVHTGRVEFQVVSEQLGFWWRLYPPSKAACLLSRSGSTGTGAVESAVGGVDDGHGLNFEVAEEPLSVVTISVWLQDRSASALATGNADAGGSPAGLEEDEPSDVDEAWARGCAGARQLVRARVSYSYRDTGLRVAITDNEFQYPPEPLDLLSYEKLKRSSPKEQERQLEARNAIIRKVCVQLVKEYSNEDVQQQVLALREIYPYGGHEWDRHAGFLSKVKLHHEKCIKLNTGDSATFIDFSKSNDAAPPPPTAGALPAPPVLPALPAPVAEPPQPVSEEQNGAAAAAAPERGGGELPAGQAPAADAGGRSRSGSCSSSSGTPRPTTRHFDFDDLDSPRSSCRSGKGAAEGAEGAAVPAEGPASEGTPASGPETGPPPPPPDDRAVAAEEMREQLHELWGKLTGWSGPLTQETWQESGMQGIAVQDMPKEKFDSPEELGGFLVLRAAADFAQDEEGFWESRDGEPREEDYSHWRGACAYLSHMRGHLEDPANCDETWTFFWTLRARRATIVAEEQEAQWKVAEYGSGPKAEARRAQLELLGEQLKLLDRLLKNFGWHDHMGQIIFGSVDELYERAVQRLPSVKSARLRAVKSAGLPATQASVWKALNLGEERYDKDPVVGDANTTSLWLLRCIPAPPPDVYERAASALEDERIYVGTPAELHPGPPDCKRLLIDGVPCPFTAVEALYMQKAFTCRFGGSKAGRYMVTSVQELHAQSFIFLAAAVLEAREVLRSIIERMGEAGKDLKVERRALVAYHLPGEQLPPWQEAAGARSRKLALVLHVSPGHSSCADGGELRLHRIGGRCRSGDGPSDAIAVPDVLSMPAGFGNWACYRVREFLLEVGDVRAPRGRCHIVVCAGDSVGLSLRAPRPLAGGSAEPECACCRFATEDVALLPCPGGHHICQACLQREARKAAVPTCPACANAEDGRVAATSRWRLFEGDLPAAVGCVCAGQCIDPGARVMITDGSTGLAGRMGEALWWDLENQAWDVRVFATGRLLRLRPSSLALAGCCAPGSSLRACPGAWPGGRGIWPVSLGSRCVVKMGIDLCSGSAEEPVGYPYFHGADFLPFDSLVTRLEAILFFLRHDFRGFFFTNDTNDVEVPGFSSRMRFENHRSALHSFPHHHPANDRAKLERRIQRFRLVCEHARTGRSSRTLVFIRFLRDSREFALIDEAYATLRLWAGGNFRLIFVSMLQTQKESAKLYRHARLPRVLVHLIGEVTLLDSKPISEVCRWAVLDEAGMLGGLPTISPEELRAQAAAFADPHTKDWLLPLEGEDPLRFPFARGVLEAAPALLEAARRGDVAALEGSLARGADANAWDDDGLSVLHHLACAESRGVRADDVVASVASALLMHADPGCRDFGQETPLQRARRFRASARVEALLQAASASEDPDPAALMSALESLVEPRRSRLALVLDLRCLRSVEASPSAAAPSTRPPAAAAAVLAGLEPELRRLEREPERERRRALKALLLRWHPDRNARDVAVATEVFQALQGRKAKILRC